MTLEEVAERWGLTPSGVDFALEQYQKVICEITHGMMSKLNYYAKDILQMAQERWCNTCELKKVQEPVKPINVGTYHKMYSKVRYGNCPICGYEVEKEEDRNFCSKCGRPLKWE